MKFSILMACHNKEKYIQACIESVLNQTYDDWELIVIDDCSTDRSYSFICSFNDPRIIKVHNDKRHFCSSTYNIALGRATGEICGVVDGDDVLSKKAIAKVIRRYKEHPEIDWIYTQFYWCDKNLVRKRTGLCRLPGSGKSLAEMALKGQHCYSHWRTFRTCLRDKGTLFPEGLKVSVDKNLGFTLEELGPGAFLPNKLYHYRYYKDNMSLTLSKEQKEKTLEMAKRRISVRRQEKLTVYPIIAIK